MRYLYLAPSILPLYSPCNSLYENSNQALNGFTNASSLVILLVYRILYEELHSQKQLTDDHTLMQVTPSQAT